MLPFIVAGVTTGSIFGLAAIGLVLTYKTSGIFNFAHGAQASAAAFLFYFLADQHGMPWPLAAAICVLVAGPALGLALAWLARHVAQAPLPTKVLATVGALLAIQGILELVYPPGQNRQVAQFLPGGRVHIGGTAVGVFQFIIFGLGVVTVVGLTVFLRRARLGLAMRAVVDNPELLDVMGTSPRRVRGLAWVIGSMTAAGSGVLLAPLLPLDASTLTFLVVTAFGAAAVGGFTNLPLAYLGGLAIGVGQAFLQKYFFAATDLTAGLASSLPFLILFVLLLVAPRLRRPSQLPAIRRQPSRPARDRRRVLVRAIGAAVLLVVLVFVPSFAGLHITDWTRFLAYVVLFGSLGLLVRMSGQVSLAHASFMAVGVAAFSHLAVDHGWPWFVAAPAAMLVAAPIGAVLAIPAIRFPGLYLALATLGFGILLQQMFYGQNYMFSSVGFGLTIPRPHLFGLDLTSDQGYYYFVLVVTALVVVFVMLLSRGRLGRLLRAMADSSTGLRSCGTSINVSRVLVFCVSASIAALAGVLDGGATGIVGPDGYPPLLSLQLFVLVLLAAGNVPWYAVLAAASQVLIPSYLSFGATVNYLLTFVFGASTMVYCVAQARTAARRPSAPSGPSTPRLRHRPPPRQTEPVPAGTGLAVDGLTVRFGGLVAVDRVSLTAPVGRITALVGPNGAGKTTVFNACSGLVRSKSGMVRLDGRNLRGLGSPARARRGLGRTFQQMELFDSLTVYENVALGSEASFAAGNPLRHILGTRHQRDTVRARADEAIELCGLLDLTNARVGELSTGQRRLVELARCLAGPYDILLLDEPSSGLDRAETRRFGELLRRVVGERNVGILLVEHDMALVRSICDHVYVIDFGKPLFDGSVAEVAASSAVREAYLGRVDDAQPVGGDSA